MSSSNSSYISKKLEEETEICRQTVKLLKNIGNGCTTLTKELNYQLSLSFKAQNLYKRVLSRQYHTDSPDDPSPSITTSRDSLIEQMNNCKNIVNRLKKSLLQSLPFSERLDCLHKLRRCKQLLIFLKEIIAEENEKIINSMAVTKWPANHYTDKVYIRIIGCERLNRSFSMESIVTGLPSVLKKSIANSRLMDNGYNSNASVKCDLIANSHVIFSTVTRPPSEHCWNQTFEFNHDFGNLLALHVNWVSPYRSLNTLIKNHNPNYSKLDFVLAGFVYLSLDEEKDRGFISRTIDLYPAGKIFIETFIKPPIKRKPIHKNRISLSTSRSIISQSPDTTIPTKTAAVGLKLDFQMIALLGTGHFGKIILCKRISTNKFYAVKALKKMDIINHNDYAQVMEEKKVLRIITECQHPFLLHLFACLQDSKYIMFVLDFVEAGDLATHIHRMKAFSDNQTRFYAAIIVLCIEFLHDNNIMYRDLKMENLLIDKYGYLKLVDFGLSKTNSNKITRTNTFCGTIDYMAPEMLIDNSYTRMVDWWALGVLIYYMIIGKVPFAEETDMESLNAIIVKPIILPKTISASLSSLILSLMDRNPYSRLGSQNGAGDIKIHSYFKSIRFSKLISRQICSPFIPELEHPLDLSYFDSQFTKKKPTLESAESVTSKTCDDESFFDDFCL